jgi:mRNA-degrading endonuclease RelE of RelBE toxin-antitoxin system
MTYRVSLGAGVERQLASIPDVGAAWAIVEFINGPLLDDPHRVGTMLKAPWEGHLSAHVGTYRVVYRIDDDAVVVTVVRVGHRGHV